MKLAPTRPTRRELERQLEVARKRGRKGPRPVGRAGFYSVIYPRLVRAAKRHGYALAIHGSMRRDFDLVAVPWVEEATDALTLIKSLKRSVRAVTTCLRFDRLYPTCDPHKKPHGRIAYALHFTSDGCRGAYIDVSVMPRRRNLAGKGDR